MLLLITAENYDLRILRSILFEHTIPRTSSWAPELPTTNWGQREHWKWREVLADRGKPLERVSYFVLRTGQHDLLAIKERQEIGDWNRRGSSSRSSDYTQRHLENFPRTDRQGLATRHGGTAIPLAIQLLRATALRIFPEKQAGENLYFS